MISPSVSVDLPSYNHGYSKASVTRWLCKPHLNLQHVTHLRALEFKQQRKICINLKFRLAFTVNFSVSETQDGSSHRYAQCHSVLYSGLGLWENKCMYSILITVNGLDKYNEVQLLKRTQEFTQKYV